MDQKRAPAADQPGEETPNTGLKPYDFKSPNRLSREHIRRIEYLHSSVAKRLGVALAGLVESVPSPGAVFSFEIQPLGGLGIINVDLLLAFSLIDRLFGGTGDPLPEPRELTTIEQTVVRKVASKVLDEIALAWLAVAEAEFRQPKYVASLEFLSSPSFNESMVRVDLEIEKGTLTAGISIAYPYMVFEPIIKRGGQKEDDSGKGEGNAQTRELIKRIVPLELTAFLPLSMVRFGELMSLDKGDVLVLDAHVSDEVFMRVGKTPLLAGRPGKSRGNLAVKVTRVFKKGGS